MDTKIPTQYKQNIFITLFKKFIHTNIGAKIGFLMGIKGFNMIEVEHCRFQRFHKRGDKLRMGEFIQQIGDTTQLGVYKIDKLSFSFNSRVDVGAALIASQITGTTLGGISSPGAPKYIALSTSSLSPAHGDTTLSGETSVAGLGRALGTQGSYTAPSGLDASASYTVTKTFTLTGSATTVVSAALFDAASTGNLFVEANFSSSAAMATNDTLAVTWTVNL